MHDRRTPVSRRAILAVVGSVCLGAPARADEFITTMPPQTSNPPPLRPDGEPVIPNDPKLTQSFLSLIPALLRNVRLERTLTTETEAWGRVFRADFSMLAGNAAAETGKVNRLVFWDGPGGTPFILIALGQPIPPLP